MLIYTKQEINFYFIIYYLKRVENRTIFSFYYIYIYLYIYIYIYIQKSNRSDNFIVISCTELVDCVINNAFSIFFSFHLSKIYYQSYVFINNKNFYI